EVGLRVAMVGDYLRDDPVRAFPHAVLDAGHHFGSEGSVDDLAQPEVTRVVKVDHRAHKLRDLGWHLNEGGARRDGTEDLGVATGVVDVGEPGEGPVARARNEALEIRDLEEGDRRLAS